MHGHRGQEHEKLVLEVENGIAVITLNQPKKLNAMDLDSYKQLTVNLQAINNREDVFMTVLTGRGTFFSAGADIKQRRPENEELAENDTVRSATLRRLADQNMDLIDQMAHHSKLLVVALNGPVIGLSAALCGWADFIYAVENAYLLTPFSALSLASEGGASLTFPRRMGLAKANEALIMGKKLGASELQANGFVNKVFPQSSDAVFIQSVVSYLREKFADLDHDACLMTKKLIRKNLPDPDAANLREIFAGADALASGKVAAHFARLAAKEMRHKV